MARLEDAVREAPGGTALNLDVHPVARHPGFPSGFNPWRGRIQARVEAPAEDGEANAALRTLVGAFFGVPTAAVQLTQGHTDRQKVVVVQGLPWKTAIQRLREGLDASR
jgi:uncharacterized protein